MKRAIFTLAVLLTAFGNAAFAQRNAGMKTDATKRVLKHFGIRDRSDMVPQAASWQSVFGVSYRTTYTYDEFESYLVEELTETDLGDGWMPAQRVAYEYDFAGNVLELVVSEFVGGEWEDGQISTYTYEGETLSEIEHQYWDGSAWQKDMKEVYNYNGDIITILFWEWTGTTWMSSELFTYTFSQNTIEVLMQYMQGGAWQNEGKQIMTLDFDERITEILEQVWAGTSWVNDGLTTYNYAGGVFDTKTVQYWNGTSWLDYKRFVYEYDNNGNAIHGECFEMMIDQWQASDGDIEMAYGYGEKSNEYYGASVEVQYVDLTGVDESQATAGFKAYPVPAQGQIGIEAEGFAKAEIHSLAGHLLLESSQPRMNVEALAAGIYLLKVYDQEGRAETQRIVVK